MLSFKDLVKTGKKVIMASMASLLFGLSTCLTVPVLAESTPFNDVASGQWYSDGISYVYKQKIMTGLNSTTFGLNNPIDRAMTVTILHRIAGSPASSTNYTFKDVYSGQYYTNAVRWAYGNSITTGYNTETFGTSDSLTREQLALFLYRFARYQNKDVTVQAPLSSFPDGSKLTGQARTAMQWAVANGYITGDNGYLNPGGICTRAMTAVIIARYLNPSFASGGTEEPTSGKITAGTAKELANAWSNLKSSSGSETNRVIIRAKNAIDNFEPFNPQVIIEGPEDFYVLQFNQSSEARQAASYFNTRSDVAHAFVEPASTGYAHLNWGANAINSDAYKSKLSANGTPIVVAVIDTGADLDHPLLKDRLLSGYDFASMDNDPSDSDGHGSHVSGIIADITQGLNIYILPIQIFSEDNPYSSDYEVASGIQYAIEQGADLINLSIGIKGHSNYVDSAIDEAVARGIPVVAAAGNEYRDVATYCPAHMEKTITVGAIDEDTKLGWYSNYGDQIDVVAPGTGINSTYINDGYHELTGTSMACPFVSAAAAMLLYDHPNLNPDQVKSLIRTYVTDLGAEGWDPYYGAGLINLSMYKN